VAKLLLAGASVTMLCSALLRRGISYIEVLARDFARWMEEHGFESVRDMQGKMSQQDCPDQEAFERAHYIRGLRSFMKAGPAEI
jgi:dihydroorotate dehydrogenase (fumarate)